MYPEFVHELQDESGMNVDLRDQGTIFFVAPEHLRERPRLTADCPLPSPLSELEPALGHVNLPAIYLKERSVDPRALTAAALKAARHRGVDIASGTAVTEVLLANGGVSGVSTDRTSLFGSRGGELCGRVGRAVAAAPISDPPGQGTDAVAGGGIARPVPPRHPRS